MPVCYDVRILFCSLFIAAIVGVIHSASPTAYAVTLAKNGEAQAAIIIASDAGPNTQQAAADLAGILHRVTGGEFKVVSEVPAQGDRLWIGAHPELANRLPDADLAVDSPESFVIVAADNDLAIVGQDSVYGEKQTESGSAVGVYTFAEKYLNVRWLWPGELGEDIVPQPTVVFEGFTYRFEPLLRERQLRMPTFTRQLRYFEKGQLPEFIDGLILNEMNDAMKAWRRYQRLEYGVPHHAQWFHAGHAFGKWWTRYSKSHSEVFALQLDGTRTPDPNAHRVKLCLSNPQTWELWMQEVQQVIKDKPWQTIFSASPNDSAFRGICTCENCRALDPQQGPMVTLTSLGQAYENVAITDRLVYFWNQLGKRLEDAYPGKNYYVAGYGYGPYVTPPVNQTLRDNVAISYVGNISTASQEKRAANRKSWQQWADKANMIVWRPNLFHETTMGYIATPVLATKQLSEDIRFLADHQMVGIHVDSIFEHWALQGPMYYLLAQMAWDPYADAQALLADYYQRGFGPAAESVAQYYELLEKIHYARMENPYLGGRGEIIRQLPVFYNDQVLAEATQLLDTARSAVASTDARYQKRVAFVAEGLAFIKAQMAVIRAMQNLTLGQGGSMRELVVQARDAYADLTAVLADSFGSFSISAVHYLAWVKNRSLTDALGPLNPTYLTYLEQDDRVTHLPTRWDFRLDPQQVGVEKQWYADTSRAGWQPLLVTSWWGEQLQSDDPVDPEPINHLGDAWYRLTFDAPELALHERLWLEFGAIDESCWVYINGKLVGEQIYDAQVNPDAWQQPRRFDITDQLTSRDNLVAVKVQSLRGAGGIWRGAMLKRSPANLIDDGRFAQNSNSWRVRDRGVNAWGGVEDAAFDGRLTFADQPGKYVNDPAVQITKNHSDIVQVVNASAVHGEAGRYSVRLRYKQDAIGDAGETYISIRTSFRDGDQRHDVWSRTPKGDMNQWATIQDIFEVDQPFDKVVVTLFLRGHASFTLDEVAVERME